MVTLLRSIGATVTGMLVAFLLVIAVEFFSAIVHPVPADFDGSAEQMCQHVERYPAWVLAVVIPAWGAAALAGTWTAGRLANRLAALFVGLLLLVAVLFNVAMLPYPLWFKVAAPLAIIAGIACGMNGTRRRNAPVLNVAA